MVDWSAIAIVFSVYAAAVVIPGPNFVAVTHKAVAGRRSDALALVAGIVTVNLFWATCAILGIGMVFAIFPWLAVGVRLAGAAYLIWFGLRLVVSARANPLGSTSPNEGASVSCRVPARYRDKYREPEVHRLLCGGLFLSGAHPRFHADVLRDACYCRYISDVLVRSSRARSIAHGDRDGVSSREGMDRPHLWRAHDCAGNTAGIALTKCPAQPI
ncbi:LysE family translocator [Paraburkholderia youngii]|uniref:LysE family translocator n=1 Tax=Paraburkholderia youngii TaxID=2782701 RepID=UPI003D1C81E7